MAWLRVEMMPLGNVSLHPLISYTWLNIRNVYLYMLHQVVDMEPDVIYLIADVFETCVLSNLVFSTIYFLSAFLYRTKAMNQNQVRRKIRNCRKDSRKPEIEPHLMSKEVEGREIREMPPKTKAVGDQDTSVHLVDTSFEFLAVNPTLV